MRVNVNILKDRCQVFGLPEMLGFACWLWPLGILFGLLEPGYRVVFTAAIFLVVATICVLFVREK